MQQQQAAGVGAPTFTTPTVAPLTMEQVLKAKEESSPDDLCFFIPKACAGAIIGKGGQNLRDLMAAFRVRVFVERDEIEGMRLVIISPPHEADNQPAAAAVEEITEEATGLRFMCSMILIRLYEAMFELCIVWCVHFDTFRRSPSPGVNRTCCWRRGRNRRDADR